MWSDEDDGDFDIKPSNIGPAQKPDPGLSKGPSAKGVRPFARPRSEDDLNPSHSPRGRRMIRLEALPGWHRFLR
jgi:hypothetical protein